MRRKLVILISLFLVFGLFAMPVYAEEVQWAGKLVDPDEVPLLESKEITGQDIDDISSQVYGTTDWIGYTAAPCDAFNRSPNSPAESLNCNIITVPSGNTITYVGFPLHIPTGAEVQYVRVYYYDDISGGSPSIGLWKSDRYGNATLVLDLAPASSDSGDQFADFGPISETIDNAPYTGYYYYILAILDRSGSQYEGIYKFYVYYKLQVSPAPGTATFGDVGTGHPFFQWVEALVDSGITAGCGGGNYCPDDPVTRGQMAVFLSKALGLHWSY